MPSHPSYSNIGAFVAFKQSAAADALAAGAGDATETSGTGFDRYVNAADGSAGIVNSAVFVLAAIATLTAAKTATFKATIQDSDALGSGYGDIAAALQPGGAADSVVLTLNTTGANAGKYEHNIDLSSLKRYIRSQVHVDLSAGGTDVASYQSGFIVGGVSSGPIPI